MTKFVMAKEDTFMKGTSQLVLKQGKKYEVTKEEADGSIWIDSERMRNHYWSEPDKFFTKGPVKVKVLRCINNEGWEDLFDLHDELRVIDENDEIFTVTLSYYKGDKLMSGDLAFSKHSDGKGRSYKTWFELAEYEIK